METGAFGKPLLTLEEIRSTRLKLMPIMLAIAFGVDGAISLNQKISDIEAKGGAAEYYGWPDGATVLWERPSPNDPIDEEKLSEMYYFFHRGVRLAKMKGYKC